MNNIRQEARAKASDLIEFFAEVQKSVISDSISISINPLFVASACESCLIDLQRHREFHRIEIADRHKRAAFLFKWLAKFRPIGLISYKSGPGAGKALHINEWFALLAALGELNLDAHKLAPTKIAQHIIYTAAYREIIPETWALTFCLLELQFPLKPA